MKIKAILLRPLNGAEIGSVAEYDKADFDRLKANGAVKAAPEPQTDSEEDEAPRRRNTRK